MIQTLRAIERKCSQDMFVQKWVNCPLILLNINIPLNIESANMTSWASEEGAEIRSESDTVIKFDFWLKFVTALLLALL